MIDFSPLSKVWIYQSDSTFSDVQISYIKTQAEKFINDWTAHGKLLKAKLEIRYAQFLVLFADESQATASGCGIDKSFHFFQRLEKELNVNLMNRMLVAYKQNEEVKTCSLSNFENKLKTGEISADTIVFNNLVTSKAEMDSKWEISVKHSWHSKMLV